MVKFTRQIAFVILCSLLSSCVTQNFDKNKLVIEKSSSNHELAMTRVSLGLGYLKMGNTNQAKYNLEKAKIFGPDLVEVHTAFAHYYETVDEPELTITSYKKALSIKSDDANTLNNYGVFLCRKERYDEAEKQFLTAIQMPSYLLVSESYENLALCQLKAGDFDKAERYLAKAITHSPNSGSALFQMVRLEYAMGNYKEARNYEQKFEKVTRRFKPESLALTFKIYQQLGNQKTARNYGSMLVSMFPDSWEARQYILNGLERIEADDLAERYQQAKVNKLDNKIKKRTVKLSPNGYSLVSSVKKEASLLIDNSQSKRSEVDLNVNKDSSLEKGVYFADKNVSNDELETGAIFITAAEKIEKKSVAEVIETAIRAIHVVEKGDNLFSISVQYNIQMETLKRWNNFNDNLKIRIGDEIFISEPLRVNDTDD
jgi:type IV pilus assembly protein PilF